MMLLLNILLDYFICNISAATAEIATSPKMSAPILFAKMMKFIKYFIRAFALNPLHQSIYRNLRRDRYEKMNMILGYMTLDYVYILTDTYFSDNISYPMRNLSLQYLFPVFRDPNHLKMDHESCVGTVPVFTHKKQGNKNG